LQLSPLLRSSIDALEEAIDQYKEGTEKSNKFCILFCDHTIELILKEKLRNIRVSIYNKKGRTIEFYDALDTLENNRGAKIQERPDLEMIHDVRNNVQHRGATVSKTEAEFYLKTTYDFIRRFLKDELKLELKDILESRYYEIYEQKIKKAEQPRYYEKFEEIKKAEQTIKITSEAETKRFSVAEGASLVLMEYRNLEIKLNQLGQKLNLALPQRRDVSPSKIVNILISNGYLPEKSMYYFDIIRRIRNKVAHTAEQITGDELENYVLAMMRFKNDIENIYIK
jgi:hypothetical protein